MLEHGLYRLTLVSPLWTGVVMNTAGGGEDYRARQWAVVQAMRGDAALAERCEVIAPDALHADPSFSREGPDRGRGWTDYGGMPRSPVAFVRLRMTGEGPEYAGNGLNLSVRERYFTAHDFGVMSFTYVAELTLERAMDAAEVRAFVDEVCDQRLPAEVVEQARFALDALEAHAGAVIDTKARADLKDDDAEEADPDLRPISVHRIWGVEPEQLPADGANALRPLVEVASRDGFQLADVGPKVQAFCGYNNSVVIGPREDRLQYAVQPVVAYYGHCYATLLDLDERLFFSINDFMAADDARAFAKRRVRLRRRLDRLRDLATFFRFRHLDELTTMKPYQKVLWNQLMASWHYERLEASLQEKITVLNAHYQRAADATSNKLSRRLNQVFALLTSMTLISAVADFTLFLTADGEAARLHPIFGPVAVGAGVAAVGLAVFAWRIGARARP